MSYSIAYKCITALYGDTDYEFSFPKELTEGSKHTIKKILFDYNKVAFEAEQGKQELFNTSDNIYFFIFEEGAALFRLCEDDGIACSHTSIMGMLIEPEYLASAWLMFDKLLNFVKRYDFTEDSLSGIVYENELDSLLDSVDCYKNCSEIWEGIDTPFSFAISLFNPNIVGVKYYPIEKTLDNILKEVDFFKMKNLESVFSSRRAFSNVDDCYDAVDYHIERYHDVSSKPGVLSLFRLRNKKPYHSIWVMKNKNSSCQPLELRFLDSEKMVRFTKIMAAMRTMSGGSTTDCGGGIYERTVINKL